MSDKKRKRNEEGAGQPKKKVARAPQGNVQVELLENTDGLGPVLAASPGLNITTRIAFKAFRHSKIVPGGQSTNQLLLQSSEHPRLDYTAREEHDGSAESQLNDFVGVFDPATNKLQLIPVKRLTIRSTLRSEAEEMREEQETKEAQQTTMMTRRHELAAEFGSKKSRKAIESMTLNAISSGKPGAPAAARTDGVADNILDNMSSAVSAMPTKADQESAIDSSKPRPKANLKAEYPSDVYTIDTVVGTELMTMIDIKDWVDACASNKGVNVTSRYVAKRIAKLAKNKQMQKLKVLRFILLCINFNAALQGSGGSRPKKIPPMGKLELAMGRDVPAGCVMAIRRKFAAQDGSDMPRWNTDNLITHIAAAALIVDDLEVDVNDLRDDLKVDNKEIRAYFSELGCKVTAPSVTDQTKWKLTKAEAYNHYIAKLKLPLSFPKLGMHRARK